MNKANILIVTGMSGAGKTLAIDELEDLGYYCVDNVPPALVKNFAELLWQSRAEFVGIAIVVDVRSRKMFGDFKECVDQLQALGYKVKMLFLDCDDAVLIRRFKETRRTHPLVSGEIPMIEDAIREERGMLGFAKSTADYVVNTSGVSVSQLKSIVTQLFLGGETGITVSCVSFGFKHGLPPDSDLVFDVRCIKNPFYIPGLRDKTGLDEAVREYVMSEGTAKVLLDKLVDLLDYLIPMYIDEGKNRLVLAIGCTGGKHRSVVFAELIAEHLKSKGIKAGVHHRHMQVSN